MEDLYERYRAALAGRVLPAAFIDLDLFDANVRAVLSRAGTRSVRVATKSLRCVPLLRRILDADQRFVGLMCATAPEAAFLAGRGFDDLLVAYPSSRPEEIRPAAQAVARGATIVLTVDSVAHLELAERIAAEEGAELPVCIDVDMSWDLPGLRFGVWRSPLCRPADVVALADRVAASRHLRLDGVLAYEAQVAGLRDRLPGRPLRAAMVRGLKRGSRRRVARRRGAVVAALREAGHSPAFVNGGGTGSLESTAADPAVSEVTAGSAFFGPALFDGYDTFTPLPAAGFALPVARVPAPGLVTCLGGGYLASGPGDGDRLPVPYLPHGLSLLSAEGAGEVQTPLRHRGSLPLGLGDPVLFRHAKAGELCERFAVLLAVRGHDVVDELPTYRGESRTFF